MTTATSRLTAVLQVRQSEVRLVQLVTGMLFFAYAGGAIGSPGIEALFYARFGVEFLPFMYIILGLVTVMTSLLVTALLARTRQDQLYMILPLVLSVLLIGARIVLIFQFRWFYPVLWLGMNVFWVFQSLFAWGIAGLVCDTRQAKRLFPLFGVGGIVGLTVGSFLTKPVVNVIGTENLILIWAFGLLIAFILAFRLLTTNKALTADDYSQRQAPGVLAELKEGFRYVRKSALLRWMSLAAVLFAILYYAIVFPFATAVATEFPDENAMAGFLGTFQGVATGVAILASLFFANRLYAAFGFMATILVYPIIYLVGFVAVAFTGSFAALVVFRFAQIFWSEGVSEGANQAMFNVVPPEQREKSRTFIRGVANQIGISLAGVLLLLARVFEARILFFVGVVAAAVTVYLVWQARKAYGPAVVAALRAGQSHIFFSDEAPFGGFHQDATAVAAAVTGINSQEVAVRRVSAEIMGNLSLPETTDTLVEALDDDDPSVRAALLRALGRAGATPALLDIAALLDDPEPEARLQAINTLSRLTTYPRGLKQYMEPMLGDPDPAVRCRAAATLLKFGPHDQAAELLKEMAMETHDTGSDISGQIFAFEALAEWGSQDAYDIAAMGLSNPSPAVRRVSATIMASIDAEQCVLPLRSALGDEDESVRESVAMALGQIGEPALQMTVSSLKNPKLEDGALLALEYLPARSAAPDIKAYAGRQLEVALHYHEIWLDCRQRLPEDSSSGEPKNRMEADRYRLLNDVLWDKVHYHATNALRAMAVLGHTRAIKLAISNLDSQDSNQRANAMETLDSLGDPEIVRPLLPLWEPAASSATRPKSGDGLLAILSDKDPWLRACGAVAAVGVSNPEIVNQLDQMAQNDPEAIVREAAQLALNGEMSMDTLQTLSTMERILFLRRVPLFAELPPADLKQLAAVAGELHFSDGSVIATQGERGDMMYMIVDGEVLVSVDKEDSTSLVLGRRGPGEYVGEMAIISHETRMASLTASGDVRTLYINQRQFMEIMRLRPETSVAVMRVLCQRLREREESEY